MPLQTGTSLRRYRIGKEWFSSKQAVTNRAKSILHEYEPGEVLNKKDFLFIISLLENHPDARKKIDCGVILIYVQANSKFANQNFCVIRKDGTETDFSYLMCIRPISPINQFSFCCRLAISDQIISFRDSIFQDSDKVRCPITKQMITKAESHVHHLSPSFAKLVASFIHEQGIVLTDVRYKDHLDGRIGQEFADPTLANSWAEYHRLHANLRLISLIAHQPSMGKRR